ncbi:MAG: hypothetical protein ABR536_05630 [Solirubrobacterales bacterium]
MADKKSPSKTERVEIGFNAGQVIAARIDAKATAELRKAAETGEGWHVLSGEDGDVTLNLAQVVFIRTASPEQRVGFGG